MRPRRIHAARAAVLTATLALLTTVVGGGTATAQDEASGEPVQVCELAYYTGEFGPYGESLTYDVVFPIEEVINLDPPLGRPWELYHEDLGTVDDLQSFSLTLDGYSGRAILVTPA